MTADVKRIDRVFVIEIRIGIALEPHRDRAVESAAGSRGRVGEVARSSIKELVFGPHVVGRIDNQPASKTTARRLVPHQRLVDRRFRITPAEISRQPLVKRRVQAHNVLRKRLDRLAHCRPRF